MKESTRLLAIFSLLYCCSTSALIAAEQCEIWAAKLQSLQGSVEYKTATGNDWQAAKLDQTFCSGDSIRLLDRSRAAIRLQNETVLRLNENSQLVLSSISKKKSSWVELLKGVAHFISRTPKSLEIKTPFVNAAIDGTEFVVEANENDANVIVFDGQVTVSNDKGKVVLTNNQSAVVPKDGKPSLKVTLSPRDSVQWSLYYPPIIDYDSDFSQTPEVKSIISKMYSNNIPGAFSEFEALPKSNNVDRLVLNAALLMSVGKTIEALEQLDTALGIQSNSAPAFAIKSIIYLVQGNLSEAQIYADKNMLSNPSSSAAKLAQSYISQSNFDLEKARSLMREASASSPSNPLIWSRLSELELGFGELDLALEAANKAVSLAPNLAQSQVTLGFSHLYRFEPISASGAFEKAVTLAPHSPLAHMGLGLAVIAIGDLNEGVHLLERAAITDPGNSLIRSYLGKGYYEQNRFELAEVEFEIAKSLDSNDPTPYTYNAFLLSSENQASRALNEIQQSITRNKNNTLFRSQQLLDRDLATRSASLSPIYNNLGFKQLAIDESRKTSTINSSDFGSHRFLSEALSVEPRHEIASSSEYLQSQLLQSLNISPRFGSPPTSIVSNDNSIELQSYPSPSLFIRNKLSTNITLLSASNNTSYLNTNLGGVHNSFSFNFNHREFSTDGFQAYDHLKQDKTSFFLQSSINSKTHFQIELTDEKLAHGDIPFRSNGFVQDKFQKDTHTIDKRIGVRINVKPNITLLASAIDTKITENESDRDTIEALQEPFPGIEVDQLTDRLAEGTSTEGQILIKTRHQSISIGAGQINHDVNIDFNNPFLYNGDYFPQDPPVKILEERKHRNAYIYDVFVFPKSKTSITTGLSYDVYTSRDVSEKELNPKFGFQWNPTESLTYSFAAFQYFKRDIISNKTIEPTHIAGFNQMFDDSNASPTKRVGTAISYHVNHELFFGAQISKREIEQRFYTDSSFIVNDRVEDNAKLYSYWILNSTFSFGGTLNYDNIDTEVTTTTIIPNRPNIINTISAPFTATAKINNHLSVNFFATYVDQEVTYKGTTVDSVKIRDRFATFDASMKYIFSKKLGSLSLKINNLLSEEMKYQSSFDAAKVRVSPFIPERTISSQLKVNF